MLFNEMILTSYCQRVQLLVLNRKCHSISFKQEIFGFTNHRKRVVGYNILRRYKEPRNLIAVEPYSQVSQEPDKGSHQKPRATLPVSPLGSHFHAFLLNHTGKANVRGSI